MASILERLDDLIRGSLHRFVDRALANNSLVLYDQDVRDMDSAIDHLEEATTTMYAAARANERRLAEHQQGLERLSERVERYKATEVPETSERMMVAIGEMAAKQGLVAETQAQIERQQGQYEALRRQLAEAKVVAQTLKDQRPRMESLLTLARASHSVERVEMTLEALRGLGGDSEVATVAESIYERFNVAQARLEMIQRVDDLELLAELEQAEVADQLEMRRHRLGLETTQEEPENVEPGNPVPPAPPQDPRPPDESAPAPPTPGE